jgi:protein-S-isoprenylcysteine O-methyltransferase Ste14
MTNPRRETRGAHAMVRLFLGVFSLAAALIVLLVLPSGRWNWVQAWIFIAVYSAFLLTYGIRTLLRDPAQWEERGRGRASAKTWDKIILAAYTVFLIVLFPVCALDAGRHPDRALPLWLQGLGWLVMAAAGGIILWVMAENTFASRVARIQDDRGQTVVKGGPYRWVRHPMYLGIILLFISIPPALGSR